MFSYITPSLRGNNIKVKRGLSLIDYRYVDSLPKLDRYSSLNRFWVAYLVRAVTPDIYTLPPVEVEAMYRPEYRARSEVGAVTVSGVE